MISIRRLKQLSTALAESVVVPGDHFDFFDGSTQSFEPTLEAVCSFIKRVAPLSGP